MKLSVTNYLAAASAFCAAAFATNYLIDHPIGKIATTTNSLLAASASSSDKFKCRSPSHHDGDAIRCGFVGRSMRLYGIDAPEMPGACRPGRQCTPGDPYAARDHLAALTRGQTVTCRQVDTDRYGRKVVQCRAGAVDLSCAMVRDGFAVERYGHLTC